MVCMNNAGKSINYTRNRIKGTQKNECKMGQKVSSKRKNMIKLIVI